MAAPDDLTLPQPDFWPTPIRGNGRWEGSRVSIRDFQAQTGKRPLEQAAALRCISDLYLGEHRNAITRTHIYHILHPSFAHPQLLVEVFTENDFAAREYLNYIQMDIGTVTGWMLIVRGEWVRRNPAHSADRLLGNAVDALRTTPGLLRKVADAPRLASSERSGQCFRVFLSSGANLLLDLGRRNDVQFAAEDRLAILSHAHPDHTGGLAEALRRGIHVLAPNLVIRMLYEQGDLSGLDDRHLAYLCPCQPDQTYSNGQTRLRPLRVPHSLGSVAWLLSDGDASLLYSGEIMLRSSVYGIDWVPVLRDALAREDGRKSVLLEGSRAHVPIRVGDEARWPVAALMPQDNVVVADRNPERLLLSYAHLYNKVYDRLQRQPPYVLMSPTVRPLLSACWDLVERANETNPDVLLFRPSKNWGLAESRGLYWLNDATIRQLMRAQIQRFWFIDGKEAAKLPSFQDCRVVDLRTGSSRPLPRLERFSTKKYDVLPGWTQHSHGADVRDMVETSRSLGARVYLFHTGEKKKEEFEAWCDLKVSRLPREGVDL